MAVLELSYPVLSTSPIPADHGYLLYAALSRVVPALHADNGIAVHPICGRQLGNRQMILMPWSCLVLRVTDTQIAELIALAGKQLELGQQKFRVGVPRVAALIPTAALRSRLVTIKGFTDQESFTAAVRRQLDALSISAELSLTLGKRRTLRIKDKEVVGYEVVLGGLTAEESLSAQGNAHRTQRHRGCAIFS